MILAGVDFGMATMAFGLGNRSLGQKQISFKRSRVFKAKFGVHLHNKKSWRGVEITNEITPINERIVSLVVKVA